MDSVGACMIANDSPFTGMADQIFQRRVQGKSWKEISDEFDLGSPGKARKTFTKLTGITDYQVKGEQLLQLAKGGLDPKLTAPKIKKLKMVEQKISDKLATPSKLMVDGEEKVIQLWKDGVGQYTKLAQESGLTLEQVDQIVWREALKAADGDVWKALKIKPTSQEGIKAVRTQVFEMRSNGYTIDQVVDHVGIPKGTVEDILGGKWKPSPFQEALPKHPEYKPVIGRGARPVSKFSSDEFPFLTDQEMESLYAPDTGRQALKSYTNSGYSGINRTLREGLPGSEATKSSISAIDKSMKAVVQPMTVTRGMSMNGFGMGYIGDGTAESVVDALVGTVFEDQGFFSTSIAPEGVFHQSVRLVIEVPPGAKGVYVQGISSHKSELEFILARNTKMMVTEVTETTLESVKAAAGDMKITRSFLVKARVIVGA